MRFLFLYMNLIFLFFFVLFGGGEVKKKRDWRKMYTQQRGEWALGSSFALFFFLVFSFLVYFLVLLYREEKEDKFIM